MKRIKIMLMSLVLLAVVGGALAFKAKFVDSYCTTTPAVNGTCPTGRVCPNLAVNKTIQSPGNLYCTTTPRPGAGAGFECKTADRATAADLGCINPAVIISDND